MKTNHIPEYYQFTAERVDGGGVVTGHYAEPYIANIKHPAIFVDGKVTHQVRPETVQRVAVKVNNLRAGTRGHKSGKCPNCGAEVGTRADKNCCRRCEMRLDWEVK